MEREKKGFRCSYAVLVIILFAALAFVTDYAIIERKMNKCSCPDCNASENSKSDYVQKYLQYISYSNDGRELRTFEIILNSDGTAERNSIGIDSDSFKWTGYYRFISEDKIVLALFDKDYLTSYQCTNELDSGSCQTALVLDYDSATGTYKADNISYTEVQKENMKSLAN